MIYPCPMIASNRQRRHSVLLIILVLIGCERVPRLSSQDVPPTVSVPIGSPGAATTTSAVTVTAGPNTSGRPLTLASLDNPRSIAVGPQSEIYIADSGIPSEPYSGRVVKIDAVTGGIEPVIEGFANSPIGEGTGSYISGVSSIALHGDMLYVVTGAGAWLNDPFYAPNKLLKRTSDGAWIEVFDFTGFEYLVDPDGNGPNSNAYGVAVSMDGDVWVSDAGGNWVARLTEDGAVAAYATFPQVNGEDAVPTGIAIGPDGSAYVTLFRCQISFRSDIEVEYWARSSGCDGLSCSWKEQPAYNPNTGHTDYRWASVRFETSHLTSGTFCYHHTINHETGHVRGLKDPDWWGQCADSVMHSGVYGCTDREWPSWSDRDKVTKIAENLVQ
uniref:ScyD/ScyE family protein n=1 Tax=Thermorudis peleae TaxID=1382356 RepID=A0A831X930_9BACT